MTYNIAIDADSIVFKACSRAMNKIENTIDIELAYYEFCGEIAKIKSEIFMKGDVDNRQGIVTYNKGDQVNAVIVLSNPTSFRNDLSPSGVVYRKNRNGEMVDMGYKANRKRKPTSILGISKLKELIEKRLPNLVMKHEKAEADDIVNYLAREKGYFVAAIDKDVINANPTYCYNYNKNEWIIGKTDYQIERWYLLQTLVGDTTDNVEGAPGIGQKGAEKIMDELGPTACFDDIVPYFDSEVDAIINHMLVRMDRFDGEKIVPWSIDR